MTSETDVLVVGWGPVGQTLAILLAGHGWRVTALERQPAPYPLPRAVHLDHETARILQAAGVADAMADGRIETADFYEWRNGKGDVLLRFTSRPMGICGWPEANMFAQPELEGLLDAKARSLANVTLLRGHEVASVVERDGGVDVAARTADGATAEFRARFVVGCDGANSFVRTSIGAPVTDLGFFYDWLIVDVRPHVPKLWSPLNIQICDPTRPTTLVSGGPGRRRWEFMRLPGEAIEDLNRADTAWRLLAPWDVHPGNADLERHTVYRFQARWVDSWRKGRVLLAGDAAHQTPPFAGQGMCAGLRDAMNLAWKLDLVLRGHAPDALLDTYAEERRAHVRGMIGFAMALGRVICVPDPAEADARDASMMATRDPQATPPLPGLLVGVLHEGDPLAGKVCVQARVRTGGRDGLFDDVVGRGWTLLSLDGDPSQALPAELAAWFASLGGIAAGIGTGGAPIGDVDGRATAWLRESGAAVVLQRPDFYVFGGAPTLADTPALVTALRARLESRAS
ncbi:MAG: bifunctional 3-(3-hydroxy-phenyl)propionate/3-hydroxycinnamic acid hydroxylase [Deltaproteobacteria bacterium]|nr:bifunctional 3-(3-hydroxy-phenyl)propionate/3-hydroxycinnamic acid hydroxylase [Deltaproteobacteria bacterium]